MIKAIKLYTGADGHSHTEEGWVAEDIVHPAKGIRFKVSAPGSVYDWHNAPTEQYVITLSGTLEFETRLGETFMVQPGIVLIAMDTTGSAHKWKMIGEDPWIRVYVPFDKENELNFVADIGSGIAN